MHMTSKSGKLTAACMLAGSVVGWQAPAIAGSDNSSDTYAGDYTAGSLPPGTFIALQYAGFSRANSFVDTTGRELPNSHANVLQDITRFSYFTQLAGHTFVLEAVLPFGRLTDVNVPGTNSLVGRTLADPVVDFTYFFTSDAQTQRWLGFTNYFYLPLGRSFDNEKAINVSTPNQFTDVPQIGYTEGLGKFSPALKGFFFDFVANASIHTNGDSPINFINPPGSPPGVLSYDTLTQRPSYDVKAFLRYEPTTFQFVALGIEKSWGGEQVATNGRFAVTGLPLVIPQAPLPMTTDDFLRGHLQFQLPLTRDFSVAADVFHDFTRLGGFKDDFGFEIRLTKFFFPEPPSK
jgi:hypothetical protein